MSSGVTLHDPLWLLALLAVPVVLWWRQARRLTVWLVPFAAAWQGKSAARQTPWAVWAAMAGVALLIVALARPQRREELREVRQAGYDIMLVIDLSPSMLAEDYRRSGKPINRLQALRPVLDAFIERRPNDRIGVVVFSGRAYTLAPLTFDHRWLARQLERLRVGMLDPGTAIGDALAVALLRLEQGARTRGGKRDGAFVVLLTDGASNAGLLSPMEATELAHARGVPVYTMAIGTKGYVNMPYFSTTGEKIYQRELSDHDDLMLLWIATRTRGKFFRAGRQATIAEAFRAVEQEQKIEFRTSRRVVTAELFPWLATPGAGMVLLAAALARSGWPRKRTKMQEEEIKMMRATEGAKGGGLGGVFGSLWRDSKLGS